jgi:hypothetical protein
MQLIIIHEVSFYASTALYNSIYMRDKCMRGNCLLFLFTVIHFVVGLDEIISIVLLSSSAMHGCILLMFKSNTY